MYRVYRPEPLQGTARSSHWRDNNSPDESSYDDNDDAEDETHEERGADDEEELDALHGVAHTAGLERLELVTSGVI